MYKIFFVIFICGLLYSGCSATSNRYVRKSDTSEKDKNLRYSQNDSKNINPADTLYDEEIDSDTDPDDDPAPEDDAIDINEVMHRFDSEKKNENVTLEQSTAKERTLMEIIKYLNTPYKYGGNSKKGIDCSAFTQTIYMNALSLNLLRSARDQFTMGTPIEKEELKFGDLVFFNTRRRVKPGHVGIYIGDNLFAHASSKNGVIVSSLDHQYYSRTFMGARRIDETVF